MFVLVHISTSGVLGYFLMHILNFFSKKKFSYMDNSHSIWMMEHCFAHCIYIFLMASDPKHFLICLLVICTLSFENYLSLYSAHFLIGIFICHCWISRSWILILYNFQLVNRPFHSIRCLFILLKVFAVQKLLCLIESSFVFIACGIFCFFVFPRYLHL